MKTEKNNPKRAIPGINTLLETVQLTRLAAEYNLDFVKYITRIVISDIRKNIDSYNPPLKLQKITDMIISKMKEVTDPSLKPVINATGIVLHTNLGRASLGNELFKKLSEIISGYSNLEFDLKSGKRQNRNFHVSKLINYLTGTDDSVVVNNNAAAVMLLLHTLAKNKEVIISRGEMIEIGESFRIHEIMEASGAIIREVGTTNRTRISDYEKAINKNTALIIKPHKSNYTINGFSEETSIKELSLLCRKNKIPLIYDLGSGLLNTFRLPENDLSKEPTAVKAITHGADIVTFSGDKLLGGPQCGIIAGKKKIISKLKSTPMLRALRVDKLTYAALHYTLEQYLHSPENNKITTIKLLHQNKTELHNKAEQLTRFLKNTEVECKIIPNKAQCGGGTMPETYISSYALEVKVKNKSAKQMYMDLLHTEQPVLAVIRKGKLLIDIFAVFEKELKTIANSIISCSKQ